MAADPALILGWDDVAAVTQRLAGALAEQGRPDIVVGVLRGGMVPAVMVAHHMRVRAVRALEVTRTVSEGTDAAKTARPMIGNAASLGSIDGADVVLVDDVAGAGDTLEAAAAEVRSAGAARLRTLVCVVNEVNWALAGRVDSASLIDHLGIRCQGWVRFPWEVS